MAPPATLAQMHQRFAPVPIGELVPCGILQRTLAAPFTCSGVGLHSGADVSITLKPAPANSGVVFIRTDIKNKEEACIPALFAHVCQVTLCSVIGNSFGHTVGTVEHLMAALSGTGIDNVLIEIDGPEVPVMDGSSQAFVNMIHEVGTKKLNEPRRMIRITRPVRVEDGDKFCELLPDRGCIFEVNIDFKNPRIGKQAAIMDLAADEFCDDFAQARTFGMLEEVQAMHAAGLALGGSLENAVVLDGEDVLNEGGLRSEDEFVRHKLLDAVGDLYLAGLRIIGKYHGVKSGHALHNKLLHALFSRPDAFEIVSLAKEPQLAALAAAE